MLFYCKCWVVLCCFYTFLSGINKSIHLPFYPSIYPRWYHFTNKHTNIHKYILSQKSPLLSSGPKLVLKLCFLSILVPVRVSIHEPHYDSKCEFSLQCFSVALVYFLNNVWHLQNSNFSKQLVQIAKRHQLPAKISFLLKIPSSSF